ncbi:hypothetical protein, partial [Mesonia mobilis]|uniref:hypothetical protein n=1 Tax=Mesonia mobilis TaxID=369791 RepID=UPI0026EE459D
KIGLTECEFDDACDECKNPKGGSFAVGYVNDMCGEEVESYICRKCASENYDEKLFHLTS